MAEVEAGAETQMFKRILIANRGDKAIGLAAQGDYAQAKSAVVKLTRMRSMLGQ